MTSIIEEKVRSSSDLTVSDTETATEHKIDIPASTEHKVDVPTATEHKVDIPTTSGNRESVASTSSTLSTASSDDQPDDTKHVYHKPPKKDFILIMTALILCVFLASLDQIIISTCIPSIAKEYQSLDDIAWLGTAYLLTVTSFQPLYGKFSDIFGRKTTMLFGNFVFLIGSAVSGWATSMNMLIAGRAIAGIGAGGLLAMTFIILSDMLDMRERGKYIGAVGACFSLSSVIGPIFGGSMSDSVTWRWSFWINLPLTSLAIVFIAFFLNLPTPPGSMTDKIKRVDFMGSFMLLISVIMLLLPLSWGGVKYEWNSGIIIGLLCAGFVMLGLFFVVEAKIPKEPIFPVHLLKIRNVWATFGSLVFAGMAFFGVIFYLPLYFQVVKLESATIGGLESTPFVVGILISSIASGIWVLKRGTFAFLPTLGLLVFAVGCGLCVLLHRETPRVASIFILLICGLGMGLTMQASTLAVQAAVKPKYMATVTASVQFVRSFGQVFGVAIVGSLFNNQVESTLEKNFPTDPYILQVTKDYSTIMTNYSPDQRIVIWDSFVHALAYAFYCCMGLCIAGAVVATFIQHKELATRGDHKPKVQLEVV